jgi:hypothetical protein
MEATEIGLERRVLLVVDIEEDDAAAAALILQLEARASANGNRKPAVEPPPPCGLICSGKETKLRRRPKPMPKKSPSGRFDAAGGRAVPVHSQHVLP